MESTEHQAELDRFHEWLGDGLDDVRTLFKREHGNFYCLVEDFNVVGMGETPISAWTEACGLMATYLFSEFIDGHSIDEARRPIPTRLRWEIRRDLSRAWAQSLAQRARGVRHPKLLAFERTQMVTADQMSAGVC